MQDLDSDWNVFIVSRPFSAYADGVSGLAKAGAHVVAVDRDVRNLKETKNLQPYQLDVTNWTDLKNMYLDVSAKYGRIDVVCNNAGLFERITTAH